MYHLIQMVYVEEDPEIGATIKQTLDANFPVHVQDLLSLEILAHWPKEPQMLMVVEVWQFRLDIIERLNTTTLQFTNNPNSTTGNTTTTNNNNSNLPGAGNYTDGSQSTEYAVDDFRHLRLFEKLGTLLKSIMVVTRLLPGNQLLIFKYFLVLLYFNYLFSRSSNILILVVLIPDTP